MPDEDRPNDDDDAAIDPFAEDDDGESPIPVTTLLGAVGQFAGALFVVALLVALFIAGAIVVGWVFR